MHRNKLTQAGKFFIGPDYHNDNVHLYFVLGIISEAHRLAFYETVFARNLFGHDTGQASIQCDMDRQEVLLSTTFDSSLTDTDRFIDMYDDFISMMLTNMLIRLWRKFRNFVINIKRITWVLWQNSVVDLSGFIGTWVWVGCGYE